MPNRKEHAKTGRLVGTVIGGGLTLINEIKKQELISGYSINWWRILGMSILCRETGRVCGILPDIMEPANSPHHRRFFHSIAFAGTVVYGIGEANRSEKLNGVDKTILCSAGISYLSHLVLDSQTPAGLPGI